MADLPLPGGMTVWRATLCADTFRFDVSALGVDTITDWQDGVDKISIVCRVDSRGAGHDAGGHSRVEGHRGYSGGKCHGIYFGCG
jgi:hypothetical protein